LIGARRFRAQLLRARLFRARLFRARLFRAQLFPALGLRTWQLRARRSREVRAGRSRKPRTVLLRSRRRQVAASRVLGLLLWPVRLRSRLSAVARCGLTNLSAARAGIGSVVLRRAEAAGRRASAVRPDSGRLLAPGRGLGRAPVERAGREGITRLRPESVTRASAGTAVEPGAGTVTAARPGRAVQPRRAVGLRPESVACLRAESVACLRPHREPGPRAVGPARPEVAFGRRAPAVSRRLITRAARRCGRYRGRPEAVREAVTRPCVTATRPVGARRQAVILARADGIAAAFAGIAGRRGLLLALATAEVGIPRPPVVGAHPRPAIAVWRIVAARFLVGAVVGPARVRRQYPAGQVLVLVPLLLIGVSLLSRAVAGCREVGTLTEVVGPHRTASRRPDLRPGLPVRRELCTGGKLAVLGDPPAARSEPPIRREARIPRELTVRSPLRTGRSRWYRAKLTVRLRSARRHRAGGAARLRRAGRQHTRRQRTRWQRTRWQRTRRQRTRWQLLRVPVRVPRAAVAAGLCCPIASCCPIALCCRIPQYCCLIAL
jgi:hypothetical protein